ncbi:ClpXP protease specificity-enhancing factor [Limnohabitans sp.]|uniref:ClpXP protease specificity-enhancing factor n=1 Tax=Limnohabitans sp. TaxID=1907725 RepID=UPI00286FA283|nr:ClpXP protease specificity-enhancing factor [Limnohabitans sp.]
MLNAPDASSTRPYLLRALHEWCTDSGFTPYVAVLVDETVQVPMEYVKNGEIVLNVGYDATAGMTLGNEFIEFKARFGGVPREIIIPINRVMAIYARENGQGMSFPMGVASAAAPVPKKATPARPVLSAVETPHDGASGDEPPTPTSPSGRPTLTRVK